MMHNVCLCMHVWELLNILFVDPIVCTSIYSTFKGDNIVMAMSTKTSRLHNFTPNYLMCLASA